MANPHIAHVAGIGGSLAAKAATDARMAGLLAQARAIADDHARETAIVRDALKRMEGRHYA